MNKFIVICFSVISLLFVLPIIALNEATNISALASAAISIFNGPDNPQDLYDYGECTYWAALQRIKIGEPIPNTWGNAITWAIRAKQDGYIVNHTPSFGAIMQDPNAPGGLGHVAFVISVNPLTGVWVISEMNRVGWDEVDRRTLSASDALKYNFIHQLANLSFK